MKKSKIRIGHSSRRLSVPRPLPLFRIRQRDGKRQNRVSERLSGARGASRSRYLAVGLRNNVRQFARGDVGYQRGNNKIRQWLIKHGVKPADISMGAPQINDRATQYDGDYRGLRYKASCTTTVSTSNVALVRQLMPQLGQLVEMGCGLAAADYDSQVQYEFYKSQ